jgi:murein DD-endopeptidase MepM/ murein hydrolase activator NlpD
MTPARLALLVGSLVVLVVAVWLVFVGVPPATPSPSNVANLPSPSSAAVPSTQATAGQSAAPSTSAPGETLAPGATGGPSASATPENSLAKEAPPLSADPADLTGYVWPVNHALISHRFSPELATEGGFVLIDGVAWHDGVDLVTHCDDKVRSAHDGTVLYAGRNYDPFLGYQGNAQAIYDRLQQLGRTNEQAIVVVVDDGNGYRSVYVHLNKAEVEPGQVLQAGDVIGLEGATGFASGCHLHYGLIRMDGPWQQVVTRLLQYGYPPLVRERVNPLDVLPWGDPNAPQVLQDKVNPPSPTPLPTPPVASAEPSTEPSAPTGSPTASASPTPN